MNLDFIPESVFEAVGVVVGMATCLVILLQLIKEWRDRNPSSMGLTYVLGWLCIFIFWFLYGVRSRAIAIWLTNSVALLLQAGLLMIVWRKSRKLKPSTVFKKKEPECNIP
jgi:uncharacterized protein with PQ loop repeat